MPRLAKIDEIKKWLLGKDVYLFEVKYPYITFQVAIYAENQTEAVEKAKNKYPHLDNPQVLGVINHIIY